MGGMSDGHRGRGVAQLLLKAIETIPYLRHELCLDRVGSSSLIIVSLDCVQ